MKKLELSQDRVYCNDFSDGDQYYHVFCAFIHGKYKNVLELSRFYMKKTFKDTRNIY